MSKTLETVLFLTLICLCICYLPCPLVFGSPTYEDFTTFTHVGEEDANIVNSTHINYTDLDRNHDEYIYRNMGANYFDGDFEHDVDIQLISAVAWGTCYVWGLSNEADELRVLETGGKSFFSVMVLRDGSNNWWIRITEVESGTPYIDTYTFAYSTNVWRYLTIKRDESVGTYGTLYCYIYSDSARTSLLDTLQVALHVSKKDWQFVYALSSFNTGAGATTISGEVKNLDRCMHRLLSIKLSGEHDYLNLENVKVRVSSLVTDAETVEPVPDANVTIEIYGPEGSVWISDNMAERLLGTGIYEWESSETIKELMRDRQLCEGVYLVHVQASYCGGPTATDILEFHIDPPQEQPIELRTILLVTMIGIVGIIASVWYLDHRRLSRKLFELQEIKH